MFCRSLKCARRQLILCVKLRNRPRAKLMIKRWFAERKNKTFYSSGRVQNYFVLNDFSHFLPARQTLNTDYIVVVLPEPLMARLSCFYGFFACFSRSEKIVDHDACHSPDEHGHSANQLKEKALSAMNPLNVIAPLEYSYTTCDVLCATWETSEHSRLLIFVLFVHILIFKFCCN